MVDLVEEVVVDDFVELAVDDDVVGGVGLVVDFVLVDLVEEVVVDDFVEVAVDDFVVGVD